MFYADHLAPEPATRFAAFRVALGVVMLADLAHLYAHRALFANEWPAFVPLGPVLIIWMAVLCAFTVGAWTRAAALTNYMFAMLMLGQPTAISQIAGDSVAISLSLLAVFLPCGAGPSVDCRRGCGPASAFACERWALAGLLSLIYVDSALRKLRSPMWVAGLGVSAPAGLPSKVWLDMSWLELVPAPLLRVAGLGVIAFELLFPLLYWCKWTRTHAVVVGIALHVGIAVVYPFPAFSGLMLVFYAALLPAQWYVLVARQDEPIVASRLPFYLPPRVASLAAVSWVALTVLTYVADVAPTPGVWRVWGKVNSVVFRTTGILNHGVFDDVMFHPYRYQLRLVRNDSPMPYARDGLFAWSVRDRVWEHWWKRTQAPWVPLRDAERRIGDWAAFYWAADEDSGEVRIEMRRQRVALDGVDAGLFAENQAVPWQEIGRIRLSRDQPTEVIWNQPPDRECELGNYLVPRIGDAMSARKAERSKSLNGNVLKSKETKLEGPG